MSRQNRGAYGENESEAIESRESLEHFTSQELALRLSRDIDGSADKWKALGGRVIGIAGPIAAGKTSFGSAVVLAFKGVGIDVDFQPERVSEKALGLYIGGQNAMGDLRCVSLLYNRRFFDPRAQDRVVEQDRTMPKRFSKGPANNNLRRNPYATPFQIKMLSDCQHRVKAARTFVQRSGSNPLSFSMVDRTPFDNTVFEEANRLMYGSITTDEHRFYRCTMGCAPAFGVDTLIHLECSPQTTVKRIGVRGSPAEQAYQITYLRFLHDIWFHRIVEHHSRATNSSAIQRYFGDDADCTALQMNVVMWNEFSSIESVLERCIERAASSMPTEILFYRRADPQCPAEAIDWDIEYARASVEKREKFKQTMLKRIADRQERIVFCFN